MVGSEKIVKNVPEPVSTAVDRKWMKSQGKPENILQYFFTVNYSSEVIYVSVCLDYLNNTQERLFKDAEKSLIHPVYITKPRNLLRTYDIFIPRKHQAYTLRKNSRLSREVTESVELTASDYDICARQHDLFPTQKAAFLSTSLQN